MRKAIYRAAAIASFAVLPALMQPRAFAVSKEIIQLQTQVQQLQDMVQHLQTSNDERMGVLINLVQQNTDSVNKMTLAMNNLETALKSESQNSGATNTQLSGQIQSLNDSVDEVKARIADMTKQLQAMQAQMQNVTTPQTGAPAGQPGAAGPGGMAATAPPAPQAPPVHDLYQSALRDYNSAKYSIASSEFSEVIQFYPQDPLAGNAQFYLGEIAYRQGKFQDAIKSYDAVLEQYSGNPKAPAAQLRKGQALLQIGQKEAGVRELRSLIQRYPQTPEAREGRSKLNGMGVRISPKPSAYHE